VGVGGGTVVLEDTDGGVSPLIQVPSGLHDVPVSQHTR